MAKTHCLVFLQRVAGWIGVTTEASTELEKETQVTKGSSSQELEFPSSLDSKTSVSSTNATRDGSPYLAPSDRAVPSPPHDESHCGGLFDRPPIRDPRFPSPPNHNSPDAVPQPRKRISKSDPAPSLAPVVSFPQDRIRTSLDLGIDRTGPSTTSESTISNLDLAIDRTVSPAPPSLTIEASRRHSLELHRPSNVPTIVVEEVVGVQEDEVEQRFEPKR